MNRNRPLLLLLGLAVMTAVSLGVWRYRNLSGNAPTEAVALSISSPCDAAKQSCVARGDDFAIELSLGPGVRPMQPFEIRLRTLKGRLGEDAAVELQFQMQGMDMGINRYRLIVAETGVWTGRAILPVCSQGRSDWLAQLEIRDRGRRWVAELPFRVN